MRAQDEQRPEPTPVELAGRTLEPNGSMLRFALSLRCVMLIASLGAALGALLMFWEGGSKMLGGVQSVLADHDTKIITAAVMGATDAFLFGIVLVIFAYSVAFGFVLDVSPGDRDALPMWMRAKGVAELKNTLVSAILVYLAVDVTTDFSQSDGDPAWQILAKPLTIVLIAAAFRLSASSHSES